MFLKPGKRLRVSAVHHALAIALGLTLAGAAAATTSHSSEDLTSLSLSQLMEIDVTLPSRRPESRALASSPIYVISQDDIRRSGFTTIAGALSLAPGMQVARLTSDQWAVGVRGFASRLSRSVLALMDGRSLYTPLFAGTYWEIQDTVLDDIDRIEIVRGPGGTLWGSNAVNGVINIVTKSAKDTQGVLLSGGGGSVERGFGNARYGGQVGENLYYRVYGKYNDRSSFDNTSGPDVDDWHMGRGGFRLDWEPPGPDRVTFQGDAYDGRLGEIVGTAHYQPPFFTTVDQSARVSGANLLGRWSRQLDATSNFTVQTYYDHTFRSEANFTEERNTFDLDAQHHAPIFWNQDIVWGMDYRFSHDFTHSAETVVFDPDSKTLHQVSAFVQDEMWLLPETLRLTGGSKFEHTTYNDFNYQPSISILGLPQPNHSLWASISRAVRTPSRIEHDLFLTTTPVNGVRPDYETCIDSASGTPGACIYPRVSRNTDFKAETLLAYQVGYRTQPSARTFVDVAAFYNEHHHLLSLQTAAPFAEAEPPQPHIIVPLIFANALHGKSYGFEVAAGIQATDWWRIGASYSFLEIALSEQGTTSTMQSKATEDASPHHQAVLQSKMDGPWGTQLDAVARYVDELRTSGQTIPSYFDFDVRLAKRIGEHFEIAAIGQNLWQPDHREFAPGSEVPRGAYGQIRCVW